MSQCKAQTKSGSRCKNLSVPDSVHCWVHQEVIDFGQLVATSLGAGIGNVIAPGFGGVVLGALAGKFTNDFIRENTVVKRRVFVSFDFDNDRQLKDFIIGQSRLSDSPFEIADHSLKEAAPERSWEEKAQAAIIRSDIVIVMVGSNTYRASGVLKEVKMAREAGIKIVQVIGYKDGNYTAVPNAGTLYRWNWENLKKLLG